VDKSNPGHVQRHRLTHLEWHLKSTAERASQLYRLHSCQAVIVMAEERISHMFEKYLPDAVRGRIITRIFGSPVADPRERRDLIENAIQAHKAISETAAITEVKEHKPHEDVISRPAEVIDALNLFLVRKLVISGSLRQSGFVCRDHHFVSLHEGTCPFCGKQLLAVENVIDEMTEIARTHGMSVTIVEYNESLLAAYGGIVAILYPHTAQLAEAA
jgi:peptide subunit release factor 1 (eRF1)